MDKIMKIFIKAAFGIILFAVYIFIVNIAGNLYGNGTYSMFDDRNAYIFCICISGIITPVLNFLYMKVLRFDYEKLTDYLPSAVLFSTMCLTMGVSNSTYELSIYLLLLYVVGNAINYCVYCLIHAEKERRHMLLKRIVSAAVLYAIYTLIIIAYFFTAIPFLPIVVLGVIITLIFCFISTKYLKIFNDIGGLLATIVIFILIANAIFWYYSASDLGWAITFIIVTTFIYASVGLAAFVITMMGRSVKGARSGEPYWQTAGDSFPDRAEEKDNTDNTAENELTDKLEP